MWHFSAHFTALCSRATGSSTACHLQGRIVACALESWILWPSTKQSLYIIPNMELTKTGKHTGFYTFALAKTGIA